MFKWVLELPGVDRLQGMLQKWHVGEPEKIVLPDGMTFHIPRKGAARLEALTGAFVSAQYEEQNRLKQQDLQLKDQDIARLQALSTTDILTGLPNRAGFNHDLRTRYEQSLRDQTGFAIVAIDGNGIKKVNDSCGHAGGDAAIVNMGETLRKALRTTDFLARVGGDEFIVILTSPITLEDAVTTAQKMGKALAEHNFMYRGEEIKMTASFGVSVFKAPTYNRDTHNFEGGTVIKNPEEIVLQADQALYGAKENGRREVCFYGNDGHFYMHRDDGAINPLPYRPIEQQRPPSLTEALEKA